MKTLFSIQILLVCFITFTFGQDSPVNNIKPRNVGIKDTVSKVDTVGEGTPLRLNQKFKKGEEFPDIALKDVNGNILKLSSLRGHYVLVDFWASWCGPCRQENPDVVKAYITFKDKNFTVYSISLDVDKNKWQKAINHDLLAWQYHVCDFMGWKSPLVDQFQIAGIPFNYLIDKDGKVLAFDLRGPELEKALMKYMK